MGLVAKNTQPDWSEAKRIVLGIIQESGGSFVGRTRLYKAFYDAHLIYWKETGQFLTTHPVVHMPNGPGINDGRAILAELQCESKLVFGERSNGPYTEGVYRLAADVTIELTHDEKSAIDGAIAWIGNKSASQVSQESHDRSRTWREADEARAVGTELHIYLDALSEEAHDAKLELLRDTRGLLDDFLG